MQFHRPELDTGDRRSRARRDAAEPLTSTECGARPSAALWPYFGRRNWLASDNGESPSRAGRLHRWSET